MSKYLTIDDFKSWGPVNISSTTDDTALQESLDWAEGIFESVTGSQFNQATETNETPARAWIDRNGVIVVIAQRRGPVTAVSNLQIMIPGIQAWTTIDLSTADVRLPLADAPPRPNAWRYEVLPASVTLYGVPADTLWCKWTYTGGYSVTPDPLKTTLLRMAQWKYKLREAPLGRISSEMFGTREIIPDLPRDIRQDLARWTKKANG